MFYYIRHPFTLKYHVLKSIDINLYFYMLKVAGLRPDPFEVILSPLGILTGEKVLSYATSMNLGGIYHAA